MVALAFAGNAGASGTQTPVEDGLTGDWGGIRTQLRDFGMDFKIGYTSETASNVRGGPKDSTLYTDQYGFGLTLDLEKLLKLSQAQLQTTITDRNGHNLSSAEDLNTLQQVQELYGRGQTWLITQLWYRQTYFNKMLDWKIGRMTVGEDFASFSCDFMNLTFCGAAPGNIVSYWYNWPISQYATRLKLTLDGFGYLQAGGYEVNPKYLLQSYAFTLANPPDATGALIPVELGWLPHLGAAQLTGSYKVGVWYDTSRARDVVSDMPLPRADGEPLPRSGRHGAYLSAQQQLTHAPDANPKQGLNVFFNATFADRRTSTTDNQIAAGVVYTGLCAARVDDDIALALGRTHVNTRVTAAERLVNVVDPNPNGVQTSEYVGELDYSWHVARWLILRPNLQYVRQPGGYRQRTDDVVLGLKVVLAL